MNISKRISEELNLNINSVNKAIELLDEGNTVPFIARYRKEATNNLNDEELRNLEERLIYLRNLDERITTVINSIRSQDKLTKELEDKINNVLTLAELEDLYRPYKPKRKTRASIAKEKGLLPLATLIFEQKAIDNFDAYVNSFINPEKKVNNYDEAIQGALDIISEIISDEADYRSFIKKYLYNNALIQTKELNKDEKDTFTMYKDYKEPINKIPSHRILAINRGEKLKCLKVKLEYDIDVIKEYIQNKIIKSKLYLNLLNSSIDDSLSRLILPSVENEVRTDLFSKAEEKSISVFKKNLYQLLMYPPIKDINVLGFDPGFRTGCKYAYVDKFGNNKFVGHSYITANSQEKVDNEIKKLTNVILNNDIDYIALGNGTASRESEVVLNKILKDNNLTSKIKLFIVNESGASVYSGSKLGQEEFPTLNVEERSAISLARRIQDPLAELVKIEPKAIGVGQYQHDMTPKKLEFSLNNVVEDVVNKVGVNINSASISLLKYISGISKSLAENIYNVRVKRNGFKSREEIKEVKGMGNKSFEQSIGFLRIINSINPLDNTGIHPESYHIANDILKETKINLKNDNEDVIKDKLSLFKIEKYLNNNKDVGRETLLDIIEELKKPGRDIREDIPIVELNNDVKDIKDLKVGMILNGTVRNIMDFGVFIDINVHQDGLCHISEISNKYIKDITDVLNVNDIVKVKVIDLDINKKRISLSIKQAY
ncbi:MAG: Tex family protein [Bacillales bacterium]